MDLKVRSANISLDTLEPEKYREITGRDFLRQTLEGISAAISAGFEQVKLNAVLIRGRNEQDIFPLIRFARQENLLLRFIELMPVTSQEMLTEVELPFYRRSPPPN